MAKVRLSKQALAKERDHLKLYQRLLPSLDLKRRQLSVEHDKARDAVDAANSRAAEFERLVAGELRMVADREIDVRGLVSVREVKVGVDNVVGVKVPKLDAVDFEVATYSLLAKPSWVDVLVEKLKEAIELRIEVGIAEQRVAALKHAVRRTTQRVNLFDRMLIPEAKANIKRIQIFLGDLERDAVVRSKLAKGKSGDAEEHAGASE